MKIISLEKDIFIYQFEPAKGSYIGINIFMIQHGNECIIIDTGYRRHFVQVLKDLNDKGLKVSKFILTHFHPDHIGGLLKVKDADIIGSIFAQDTLKRYVENYQKYLPTKVVVDKDTIIFGRHTIEMEINKGHSKDGLLITLNNKYMFVGDDVISDYHGNPSIPFCSEKDTLAHISSINMIISKSSEKIILPTHGKMLDNRDDIVKDLIKRLTYLHFINENRNATYDDFYQETKISFLGRDWHVLNQIRKVI